MPGIVVGVNGSPHSEDALIWAMAHAAALRSPLTVLAVHEVPKSYWGNIPVKGPADQSIVQAMRDAVQQLLERAESRLGDTRPPEVDVRVVSGFPVRELVAASKEADLVVLGTPHGSGLTRLVMGSVGNEVVQQSACPVTIVPRTS